MRSGPFLLFLAAGVVASSVATAQPALVCPAVSSTSSRMCNVYHYHVQMYRPDTKAFVDVAAANQFATDVACDRARDAQMKRNLAVVDYFKRVREQQYEPDRFGPCHCDGTLDEVSPSFLSDAMRKKQLRDAEEVRLRVRERLLDNKVLSDSPLIRGLYATPPPNSLIAMPKLVPMPQTVAPPPVNVSDLRATRAIDTNKPAVATMDLPLVDVLNPGAPPPVVEETHASNGTTQAETPPLEETSVAPETADAGPSPEEVASAQETAEKYVSYETQRIQNVLNASESMPDGDVKAHVLETCVQRLQLLSNLRILIEGSGMRSRLASAAREAQSESERVALARKLFGSDITNHWAPKDAADVVLDVPSEITSEPERALRDSSGKFSDQQKRRALYVLLARTQPTEEQRLWLTSVIDSFLR